MRIIRTLDRIFDRVMTWVGQESLMTSMVRLYVVSFVMLPPIMGVAWLAHSIVELIVR